MLLASVLSVALAAPVVIEQRGDLYLKQPSGTLKRLTSYGHNFSPAVSPNGKWVAYLSTPAALATDSWGRAIAQNVWLMALPSGQARRLTGQPAASTQAHTVRSTPSWSPDSALLAWAEDEQGPLDSRSTVAVYTPGTASLQQFAAPIAYIESGPPDTLAWGPGHRLAAAGPLNVGTGGMASGVIVYRLDGSWTVFGNSPGHLSIADRRWVDASTIEVTDLAGVTARLDIQTGQWK